MLVQPFIFNAFSENTYVLYDETRECVIIDPGCDQESEFKTLTDFVASKNLTPVKILQTHTHIDHILGVPFLASHYKIGVTMHKADLPVLHSQPVWAQQYGFNNLQIVQPEAFVEDGEQIAFGNSRLDILFTPGHSAGSISFFSAADKWVIAGDVLFYGSIGRTDFPFCNYDDLMRSITQKLFSLPDDTKVYSGHGPVTSIGREKRHNSFVLEYLESLPG